MLELQAWANSTSMEVFLRVLFPFYLKSCIVIYSFLLGVYLLASLQGLGALLLTECVFIWQSACIWLWGMEESTQQVLLEGHWGAGEITGEWILFLQRTWVLFPLFSESSSVLYSSSNSTHACLPLFTYPHVYTIKKKIKWRALWKDYIHGWYIVSRTL